MNTKFWKQYNTLSFQVRAALFTVAIVPLLIFLFLNNLSLTTSIKRLEENNTLAQSNHASAVVRSKANEIFKIAKDYGIWDDAYSNIKINNKAWFNETLTGWIPDNFGIDLVLVINKNKEIIDNYGLHNGDAGEFVSDKTVNKVLQGAIIKDEEKLSGFKLYNGDLYLVGVSPILQNYYRGLPEGAIILGKKITSKFLDDIKKQYGYTIFMVSNTNVVAGKAYSTTKEQYYKKFLDGKSNLIELNDSFVMGSNQIKDISGKNIGYQLILEGRDSYISTFNLIQQNGLKVLGISLLVIILLNFKIKKFIVKPIKNLEEEITKMGRNNFLGSVDIKGPNEITSLVKAFNKMASSVSTHKKENESLKALSVTDGLTGLYNHRYFYEYTSKRIADNCKELNILFFDIDRFKVVNDLKGHSVGDSVLIEIGQIIRKKIGESGLVFRYGGEEFVVVLENQSDKRAYDLAEKIRGEVSKSQILIELADFVTVTVSIGISRFPSDANNIKDLVEKADRAMYFAKESGRNKTQVYTPDIEKCFTDSTSDLAKQEMLLEAVYSLVAAIDAKDSYTEKHSKSVTKFALLLAEKLNLSEYDKHVLRIGCLLHDCGKIGIPDEIIRKNGALTEEERQVIENHTLLGSNIVKHIIKTKDIEACIRNHHERWDGAGYPDGLAGKSNTLHARIVCIADSYHAMISNRPYRNALSKEEAFRELRACQGKQFDPGLVEKFILAVEEISNTEDAEIDYSII